jgi:hypothetical protein
MKLMARSPRPTSFSPPRARAVDTARQGLNERIELPPRFRLPTFEYDKGFDCLPQFEGFNRKDLQTLDTLPLNVSILLGNVLQIYQGVVFELTEQLFMKDKNEEEGLLAQLAFLQFAQRNPHFCRPKITITPPLTSPGDSSSTATTMQLQSEPTSRFPAQLDLIANQHQEGDNKIITLTGNCAHSDDEKSSFILSDIEQAVRLMGNSLQSDS